MAEKRETKRPRRYARFGLCPCSERRGHWYGMKDYSPLVRRAAVTLCLTPMWARMLKFPVCF